MAGSLAVPFVPATEMNSVRTLAGVNSRKKNRKDKAKIAALPEKAEESVVRCRIAMVPGLRILRTGRVNNRTGSKTAARSAQVCSPGNLILILKVPLEARKNVTSEPTGWGGPFASRFWVLQNSGNPERLELTDHLHSISSLIR